MKILSWNVAGLRACVRKGFTEFIKMQKPDILCLQEIKLTEKTVPDEIKKLKSYHIYWNFAKRKGYAGTAVFTKAEPKKVESGIGIKKFDSEGRLMVLHYRNFMLVNAYFPHSHRTLNRLKFKLEFDNAYLQFVEKLKKKTKNMVLTGDFNCAHKEIDLANPKQNVKNAGFTPKERAWMDKFISKGHIDTFRQFTKGPGNYTWWTYRFNARKRNIGWRVDYFFVPKEFMKKVKNSRILKNVQGSDHAPVCLELKI
jgi:exodeoxyribonuclease-3